MSNKRLDHRREKLFQTDYRFKNTRGQNSSSYTEYYDYVKNSGKIFLISLTLSSVVAIRVRGGGGDLEQKKFSRQAW